MMALRGLLAGFCIEALVAACWSLLAFFGGARLRPSPELAVILGVAIILWLALLFVALAGWRSQAFPQGLQAKLDRFCLAKRRLVPLLAILIGIPAALLVGSWVMAHAPVNYKFIRAGGPDTASMLHSAVIATLPIQSLLGALALESAAYLGIHYRRELRDVVSEPWRHLGKSLLMLGIGLLTVFYWLVLILQLRIFKNIPAWYWKLRVIALGPGDLVFLLGALGLLGLAYWALILRRHVPAGLVLALLLGLFLQFGVGLMSGGGFAAFQDRYFSTYHSTYVAKAAASSASLLETVRQYASLYGSRSFTETKPPGLMLFYTALARLVNGSPSRFADDAAYQRLATVVTFAFPVLAVTLVLALYAVARRYIPGKCGMVPGLAALLLVLCPNFVLFSLYPDQALYPLVFLIGVVLVIVAVQRQSLLLSLALGVFLYGAVFFAFTMLPLYVFAGLYLALHFWLNRRELLLRRSVMMALAMGLGTAALYILFRAFLDYDFFPRFAKTMAINHNFDFYIRVGQPLPAAPESLWIRLSQVARAAWFNSLDFSAAVGFFIYVLFLMQGIRLLVRARNGSASASDEILAALFLSFIVLNLAGTAQGEVPRLWLFWLPMVIMGAALEIEQAVARRPWLVLLLAGTQLITLFLTFHFQDLRM